jgi:hypothetical protein
MASIVLVAGTGLGGFRRGLPKFHQQRSEQNLLPSAIVLRQFKHEANGLSLKEREREKNEPLTVRRRQNPPTARVELQPFVCLAADKEA